jgi:hypothetical protein
VFIDEVDDPVAFYTRELVRGLDGTPRQIHRRLQYAIDRRLTAVKTYWPSRSAVYATRRHWSFSIRRVGRGGSNSRRSSRRCRHDRTCSSWMTYTI